MRIKRPNQTLGIAAGIAQGAQNFVQAYQGAQNQKALQAERQALMDLRLQQMRLQQEEMEKKYGPVKVRLGLLNMLDSMEEAGAQVPTAIRTKAWNEFYEQAVQNPEIIGQVNQGARRAQSSKFRLPVQSLAEKRGKPIVEMDGQNGKIDFTKGMSFDTSRPEPEPPGTPDEVELSRAEYDLFREGRNARYRGAIEAQKGENRTLIEMLRNGTKAELEAMRAQLDTQLKAMDRESRERVAQIGADSRIKAAKINASSRSKNAAESPEAKRLFELIKQAEKPKSGISFESPAEARAREQQLQGWYQRYKEITGKDLRPSGSAPTAPNPSPSGTIKWDLKGPMPKVKRGDIVETPKGRFRVIDNEGNIEPVK